MYKRVCGFFCSLFFTGKTTLSTNIHRHPTVYQEGLVILAFEETWHVPSTFGLHFIRRNTGYETPLSYQGRKACSLVSLHLKG